jgi:hypothetical protein
MSELIQFPPETSTAVAVAETDQIITLFADDQLKLGGEVVYASIAAWKQAKNGKASSYVGVVIEVTIPPDTQATVGDGTLLQAIALYGEITGVGRFCLGVLGINTGNLMPQIPLEALDVGFAQIVADVSLYDALSVGGLTSTFNATGADDVVTFRARPIRSRDYVG